MKEENNMLQQVMTKPGEIIFREVPVPEVKDDHLPIAASSEHLTIKKEVNIQSP